MPNVAVKTALAFATALAALAVYRLADPAKGLSPAIFPEAAHVTLLRQNPATVPARQATTQPLNGIQQPQSAGIVPGQEVHRNGQPCSTFTPGVAVQGIVPTRTWHDPISPNLIENCGTLDPFFAALHSLETQQAGAPQVVTVLHYGDSPTTADLITGDVRELLQQRFHDAGRGFLLAAKPWAWYQHRGVDLSDKGWSISTAVGKGRPEVYGLGGASFEGGPEASTHITLKEPTGPAPSAAVEISYLGQPGGGSLSVSANGALLDTFSTALDSSRPFWQTVSLPPGTKSIDLKPVNGKVTLFGETLLTGRAGVLYDSLGLNGASTSVLSNGFNPVAWSSELMHDSASIKLVIINYGTNESGFGTYVDKQYEPTLRAAILRIRAALPGVPILIMSPMDRGRRSGVDQIETYDTIPRIVAIQRRVAAELNCAFFDTFNAMGGDGTMSRWYTGHPRLVAGDLIHPTPQGAAIVARLFVHDLSLGYDRYLGMALPASAQTAANHEPQTEVPQDAAPKTAPRNQAPVLPSAASKPKPSAAGEALPTPPPQASPTPSPEAPQA